MSRTRDTGSLAVGSAVTGVLAYVVFAICTRALGAEGAAPVSVLWTTWGFAAAALSFPLQHWIAQSAESDGGTAGVRRSFPRVLAVSAVATVGSFVVSWLLRDQLFHRDDLLFPALVGGLVAGAALTGLVRGGLAVDRRFGALAASLVAENALRCVSVAVLFAASVESSFAYGVCIVAGNLTCLAWPDALRFPMTGTPHAHHSPMALLAGASLGQTLGQAVLTGGPVVLALRGGSPAEITVLFAALALFRAPYSLGVGVVSGLTGWLTGLAARRRTGQLARLRLALVSVTLVGGALAAVFGGLAGPPLVRLVFGADVDIDATSSALIAAGSTVAVANLVLTVAVIAHARPGASVWGWLLGILAAAPVLLLDLVPLHGVSLAFLVAEAVAWVVMLAADVRAVKALRAPERHPPRDQ